MSESHFVRRKFCPACLSSDRQELYASSYTEPPIHTYLEDFYNPQGGVEFDYLNNVEFILDKCLDCGLVGAEIRRPERSTLPPAVRRYLVRAG